MQKTTTTTTPKPTKLDLATKVKNLQRHLEVKLDLQSLHLAQLERELSDRNKEMNTVNCMLKEIKNNTTMLQESTERLDHRMFVRHVVGLLFITCAFFLYYYAQI